MLKTDILIIGSGISGLTYAIKIAEKQPVNNNILIVTKNNINESNTKYAQGGLAVVTNLLQDNYKKHVEDTLQAGDGLCDEKIVNLVINEGPDRFQEIVNWGAKFDKNTQGNYNLIKEGGHSENRIVHYKDITGFEIERALLKHVLHNKNINILTHHYAIDLITEYQITNKKNIKNMTCYGAYVLNKNKNQIITIHSKITILATGGAGHIYKNTTNPSIATGDGIGLAFRAGAKIKNMQFFQFHPTALYHKLNKKLFLISEAVRGFGAILRLKNGESFMYKYDQRKELASRDIIARAIDNELKISKQKYVTLDCTHINKTIFLKHFPNIYNHCIQNGINPLQDYIPVVPAAHYMCGGVITDVNGLSTINNLFAIGECSYTGLHGANRLASNSLLEAIVFSHRSAIKSIQILKKNNFNIINLKKNSNWNTNKISITNTKILIASIKKELQNLMSNLVGIIRSNKTLEIAAQREKEISLSIQTLYQFSIISPELIELRNLIQVAHLIIYQSIKQKENKGTFYNKDLKK